MHVGHLFLALLVSSSIGCVGLPPPPPASDDAGAATSSTGQGPVDPTGPGGSASTDAPGSSSGLVGVDGSSSSSSSSGDTMTSSSSSTLGTGGSSSESTGGAPTVGCADGSREALVDELLFPSIAACAGGFWIPGVGSDTPQCDRQGGDDGPLPDGMGCTIDDLCVDGWHVCASRYEVENAGLVDCGAHTWGGQFFATAQSGEGANTCNDTGSNEVFGCGDVGYAMISGCTPLNRSSGNLCVSLPGAWSCSEDSYDEVSHLEKPGPDAGGALCCRD